MFWGCLFLFFFLCSRNPILVIYMLLEQLKCFRTSGHTLLLILLLWFWLLDHIWQFSEITPDSVQRIKPDQPHATASSLPDILSGPKRYSDIPWGLHKVSTRLICFLSTSLDTPGFLSTCPPPYRDNSRCWHGPKQILSTLSAKTFRRP